MNNNKKERKQQEQQRHSNSEITRGKKDWGRKQNIGDSKISFFERGNEERKSLKKKKAPFVYSEAQKHLQA